MHAKVLHFVVSFCYFGGWSVLCLGLLFRQHNVQSDYSSTVLHIINKQPGIWHMITAVSPRWIISHTRKRHSVITCFRAPEKCDEPSDIGSQLQWILVSLVSVVTCYVSGGIMLHFAYLLEDACHTWVL